jgi:hypothetical protein
MTVYVPRGLPMDLTLNVRKGESHIHLGGLSLASAALELQMGEHHVDVSEPNPIEMSELRINAAMGETEYEELSRLRAGSIVVWGRMGELRLGMGSSLTRDTKVFVRMRMGEMSVGLPPDTQIHATSRVFMADRSGNPDRAEGKHRMDLDAGATMGELSYHHSNEDQETPDTDTGSPQAPL